MPRRLWIPCHDEAEEAARAEGLVIDLIDKCVRAEGGSLVEPSSGISWLLGYGCTRIPCSNLDFSHDFDRLHDSGRN